MAELFKLTLAVKAPSIAYAALVAASVVNSEKPTSPIDISIVDEPLVDAKVPGSIAVLTGGSDNVSLTDAKEIVFYLSQKYLKLSADHKEWIEFAFASLGVKDFKTLTPSLEKLESHLNFRSFVVGYSPSAADIGVWGVLRSNAVVASVIKSGTYINITRWYKYFDEHQRAYGEAARTLFKDINDLRKQSKSGQKKESKASFDIDLVDAVDGKVVTRFPPEPSGYLHIGHAKAAILNEIFAKMYHGKLIVRFDDTNPSKEKVEYTDSILADLKLLGIVPDRITHTSDYFQEIYDLAVQLIKDGKAYCDDTVQEKMRDERMNGIASARRDRSIEENLKIFTEDMKNATEVGVKNCLRAKISVDAKNKALRDPVIYRCNLTPHHRTGDKWKIYPIYDFCNPIVDALEGVTHALRTIEYRDRNDQYSWMLESMHLRKVHVWDFSRVNFVRTLLSKRKLQWFVDNGKVAGWDDPRFPTVRGVRRRGMSVEGLRAFVAAQGPSKNINNLDWNLIWAINKKVIDPIAPRYSAVYKDNVVTMTISGAPEDPIYEEKPKHKKNADLGTKKVAFYKQVLIDQDDAKTLKVGEEVTLMDWGNAIITELPTSDGAVTAIEAKLHLEGDFKKTEKKISWIAKTDDVVPVDLVDFDHLITKDKIEDGENFEDFLTPETEFHTDALADANIKALKEGDVIQFERKGYYRLDKPYSEGSKAVFFTVPDGKSVSRYGAKQ